jgi:hypothetical protein
LKLHIEIEVKKPTNGYELAHVFNHIAQLIGTASGKPPRFIFDPRMLDGQSTPYYRITVDPLTPEELRELREAQATN